MPMMSGHPLKQQGQLRQDRIRVDKVYAVSPTAPKTVTIALLQELRRCILALDALFNRREPDKQEIACVRPSRLMALLNEASLVGYGPQGEAPQDFVRDTYVLRTRNRRSSQEVAQSAYSLREHYMNLQSLHGHVALAVFNLPEIPGEKNEKMVERIEAETAKRIEACNTVLRNINTALEFLGWSWPESRCPEPVDEETLITEIAARHSILEECREARRVLWREVKARGILLMIGRETSKREKQKKEKKNRHHNEQVVGEPVAEVAIIELEMATG